jgi:hypothetical protein
MIDDQDNTICLMSRTSTLLVTVACLLGCSNAQATCLQLCNVQLVFDDCQVPVTGQWPAELPLALVVRCGSCCSAPGGPGACRFPDQPDPTSFSVAPIGSSPRGAKPLAGRFVQRGTCVDTPRYVFDRLIPAGTYLLTAGERMTVSLVNTGGEPQTVARRPAIPFVSGEETARPRRDPLPARATSASMPPTSAPRRGGCASCSASAPGPDADAGPLIVVFIGLVALGRTAASARGRRRARSS